MKGLVIVTLLLLLTGCNGGGDDGVEMPEDIFLSLASDERVLRLVGIVERADTLLVPAVRGNYSVPGGTTTKIPFAGISCQKVECAYDGVKIMLTDLFLDDLINPGIDVSVSDVNLESRSDGFDTVTVQANLNAVDVDRALPDFTITEMPKGLGYGFWGEHGMAGLFIADGPFTGEASNIPFSGQMEVAIPFAVGDISGTNPRGTGSATWTGIAEAVSPRTFTRREGAATLTIADLSLSPPTVSVAIDIDGKPIGESGWTDVSLTDGRFTHGTAGDDYLEGNFHGAEHSEAYGVFDTDTFTGAFGAKRDVASE